AMNENVGSSTMSSSDFIIFMVCAYGYAWAAGAITILLSVPFNMVQVVATPGPILGAFVVVFRRDGISGIRNLLRRAFRWRFSPILYLVALLIPFLVLAASSGVAIVVNGAAVPDPWFLPDFTIPFLIGFLIWNGVTEEVGWRGYLLPRVQDKVGSLAASVLVGVIWAFWHLPLFIIPGSYQYGTSFAEYVLILVSWTIIMAMLYNKAQGSVIVPILLHEAQNFIAFTIVHPNGAGFYTMPFYLLFALAAIFFLPRPLAEIGRKPVQTEFDEKEES
ncbi:MAG: CPBP family intramembrane glutamic endopeptidase, partial [Promethearchaeota archaeon]